MAYNRLTPRRQAINNWYYFPKLFLKPYGIINKPIGVAEHWCKIDSTNSELHYRPSIGLLETAETIGENTKLVQETLTNIDLEEITNELDGLYETFYQLNNRNKVAADQKDVRAMCRKISYADTDIWDKMELLGKQMHLVAIHHKNVVFFGQAAKICRKSQNGGRLGPSIKIPPR